MDGRLNADTVDRPEPGIEVEVEDLAESCGAACAGTIGTRFCFES
ncbi:hypothetical protein ACIRBY_12610 [Streptomyces sp. NPDC096136]